MDIEQTNRGLRGEHEGWITAGQAEERQRSSAGLGPCRRTFGGPGPWRRMAKQLYAGVWI